LFRSRTLLVQQRAIADLSCGRLTVRLKFHCRHHVGIPLDTERWAGKTVSGRQRNWNAEANSRAI